MDWSQAPCSQHSPTTVRGGTSAMATATPGNESDTSRRARAYLCSPISRLSGQPAQVDDDVGILGISHWTSASGLRVWT